METKTRGIVLRTLKTGESSAVCHILTRDFGLLGFHIPGLYKNKGKVRISYLQPLNTVELSLHFRGTGKLQKISDIHCLSYPKLQRFSQKAFYHVLCELLQQTIHENEINPGLFGYLYEEALPGLGGDIHFWQLPYVMLHILHHCGCSPNCSTWSEDAYLDLQNGIFLETLLPLKTIAGKESSALIYQMLTRGIAHLDKDPVKRREVIQDLIRYYQWHINGHFDLKSREVLEEISR